MHRKAKLFVAYTVIIVACTLFASISHGQKMASVSTEKGGMGYSMFGSSTINIKDLNARLENKGYPSLSDKFFCVGGGGHTIISNKFIIGGEGYTLLGEEVTSGNYKNSMNITCVFLDLGYIVYKVADLRVYPLLGIGAGSMNLKITEDVTSLSLDDVLDNPNRGVELTTGGFLLNFALGIDYLLKLGEDEKSRAGVILGIRAGYMLSPAKNSWVMDDIDISGAPEIGITGPYFQLMFGGGALNKTERTQ
jgi:hypothetical protein